MAFLYLLFLYCLANISLARYIEFTEEQLETEDKSAYDPKEYEYLLRMCKVTECMKQKKAEELAKIQKCFKGCALRVSEFYEWANYLTSLVDNNPVTENTEEQLPMLPYVERDTKSLEEYTKQVDLLNKLKQDTDIKQPDDDVTLVLVDDKGNALLLPNNERAEEEAEATFLKIPTQKNENVDESEEINLTPVPGYVQRLDEQMDPFFGNKWNQDVALPSSASAEDTGYVADSGEGENEDPGKSSSDENPLERLRKESLPKIVKLIYPILTTKAIKNNPDKVRFVSLDSLPNKYRGKGAYTIFK